MTTRELATRIAQLEAQMDQLRTEVRSSQDRERPSWQRSLETFADDEDLLAILSDAMKLREAER